jgi:hypothetical protein
MISKCLSRNGLITVWLFLFNGVLKNEGGLFKTVPTITKSGHENSKWTTTLISFKIIITFESTGLLMWPSTSL